MARRTGARERVRAGLAEGGPVSDEKGRATVLLKDRVSYAGSDVGFVQLLSAMERSGEIVREVRGRRTYSIRLATQFTPTAPIKSARTTSKQGVDEPPQGGLDSGVEEIDYEELANTLLVHVMNILRQSETTDSSDWMRRIEELDGANLALQRELARTREDAESLKAERDLAVDQLDAATQELSALRLKRARVMSDQDRALLENVVHPQATHSNSSTQRAV